MFEWRWTSWDWNILKHFVKRLAWHYGTLPIEGLPRVWASKPRATSFLDVLAAPQAASMLSRKSPHVTYATWSTWYRKVEGVILILNLLCRAPWIIWISLVLCQVLKFPSLSFSYVFWFFWPWNPIEKCGKRHALLFPPNSNAFRPWMLRIVGSSWCCCAICGFNNVTKERTWRQKPQHIMLFGNLGVISEILKFWECHIDIIWVKQSGNFLRPALEHPS